MVTASRTRTITVRPCRVSRSADPERHGCPRIATTTASRQRRMPARTRRARPDDPKTRTVARTSVRLVGAQIVITEQVNFATGSDVLAPESSQVLGASRSA